MVEVVEVVEVLFLLPRGKYFPNFKNYLEEDGANT
jgi:hypothetical protein